MKLVSLTGGKCHFNNYYYIDQKNKMNIKLKKTSKVNLFKLKPDSCDF